jgi:hypothetical protein
MEAKAAAEREESRKRELAAKQHWEHRVSEVTNSAQKDVSRLQQQHAERLQVEQEKAAALVAAANEKAREAQAARDKAVQDAFEDKNKRIEQAVLYYVNAQVQSRCLS